jgi:streptomycin 6-kinase
MTRTLFAAPPRWNIRSAELRTETFSSRIWDVLLADDVRAIVKEVKPFDDMADELRGAHYLTWRAGVGAVSLLDVEANCMLLEHGGERLLTHELAERGDVYATDLMAEVLARILSPSVVTPPAELQPLHERFAALFVKARSESSRQSASEYVHAAALATRLLAEPRDVRPLHGDLHHENVLCGPRGWLVIDPKGVLGDPAFEAANVLYNPLDRDDLCMDSERIARVAEVLSRAIGQDPRRVLDYAIAYGCLSAAWHAGDANERNEQRELAIARAISVVRRGF